MVALERIVATKDDVKKRFWEVERGLKRRHLWGISMSDDGVLTMVAFLEMRVSKTDKMNGPRK